MSSDMVESSEEVHLELCSEGMETVKEEEEPEKVMEVTEGGVSSSSSSSVKCLICSNHIQSTAVMDELNLLRQLCLSLKFPLSLSEDLGSHINNVDFCETCSELLCNSACILEKIERLEREVEAIRSQFKDWILSTYNRERRGEEQVEDDDIDLRRRHARNYLRKTFVQCWVACSVDLLLLPESQLMGKALRPQVLNRTRQKKTDFRKYRSLVVESDLESDHFDSSFAPDYEPEEEEVEEPILEAPRKNRNINKAPRKGISKRIPKAKTTSAAAASLKPTRSGRVRKQQGTSSRATTRSPSLKNSKIKCGQCKRPFSNSVKLNRHMLAIHKKSVEDTEDFSHNCPYCGLKFEPLATSTLEDQENSEDTKTEEGAAAAENNPKELDKRRLEHIETCRNSLLSSASGISARSYDDRGKLTSFTCAHCSKTISSSDYIRPDGDQHVFECTSSNCCSRTFRNFPNLMFHHEAFCPAKLSAPGGGGGAKGRKRKTPLPHCTYDDKSRMISFTCPKCSQKLERSDFYKEESKSFLFQCPWEGCDKVMDNFSNLSFHHGSHCSSHSIKKPKYMDMQKRIEYILATTCTSSVAYAVNAGAGRKYDASGKVSSYRCPRCQVELRTEDFINSGQQQPGSKENKFKCSIEDCDKTTTTLSNLIFHHETHCIPQKKRITVPNYNKTGRLDSFQCIICNLVVLNEGKTAGDGSLVYTCTLSDCGMSTSTFSAFRLHHEHHCVKTIQIPRAAGVPRKSTKKPLVGKKRKSADEESSTIPASEQEQQAVTPLLKCEKCGKAYQKQGSLDAHFKKCIDEPPKVSFPCSVCKRQFATEQLLNIHSRFHELKNQLQESYLQNLLESSRKTLSPEGALISYHCQHCDKTIDQTTINVPDDAAAAQADQENSQTFRCWHNCCETLFDTFDRMVSHHVSACPMRKVHSCHVCDKSFEMPSELKSHMKNVHLILSTRKKRKGKNGEEATTKKKKSSSKRKNKDDRPKPFACRHCPKKFRGKNNCIQHMKLHLESRPVKCDTCGGTFGSKSLLKEHEETHKRQDVECVHCDRMFKTKYDLDVHMKRVHPDIA